MSAQMESSEEQDRKEAEMGVYNPPASLFL